MENLSQITLLNLKNGKKFFFSKLNFFFGYSHSGKSNIFSDLEEIFSGKNKDWMYNATTFTTNDFNVISIGPDENLSSHLKISSKSFIKKLIVDMEFSEEFENECKIVSQKLYNLSMEFEDAIKKQLPNLRTIVSGIDDIPELLLDKLTLRAIDDSSSISREALFDVVNILAANSKRPTVVLIDDFDAHFSEENCMRFIQKAKDSPAYFFLSSNRVASQAIFDGKETIYAIRNQEAIQLPKLANLIIESNGGDDSEQRLTFEEYMISLGYLKESGLTQIEIEKLKQDATSNLLRILTAESPRIADRLIDGYVTIIPKNESEKKLYSKVFELLEIPLN